ncbi:hypothetical protein Smp_02 [Stenotrophomonas phage Smp131]|uniref:Uncharacterized protein n=1 Tax=Stenotrophomonas phage Smp131 TaxID=1168563 RepID=V9IQL3_9CAUD|nr:hypothetical protein CH36_gp02 [Stenotrophomonas phage Smp131]AFJ75472.1 hypothetical protein Smp_02 [Stenotrophomonas phage Smp131]
MLPPCTRPCQSFTSAPRSFSKPGSSGQIVGPTRPAISRGLKSLGSFGLRRGASPMKNDATSSSVASNAKMPPAARPPAKGATG